MERLTMDKFQERITEAASITELRSLREEIHETFQDHLSFPIFEQWNFMINVLHDALITKAIEFAEKETYRIHGIKLSKYSFIVFGSGGRKEQTLWSDQDNGMIYFLSGQETEQDYLRFSDLVHLNLAEIGYPPCEGDVLSSNKLWRQNAEDWQQTIRKWFEDSNWENVRSLLIMADARCIYGDEHLVYDLKEILYTYVSNDPEQLVHMLRNTLFRKVSLGLFGHLITERYGEDAGGFDIKYGVYIPMNNGIRLLAIQYGIRKTSTLERIDALEAGGHVPQHMAKLWRECFLKVLKLRSMTPFQKTNGLYMTRGKLKPEILTKSRKLEIKECIKIGRQLQKYVKQQLQGGNGDAGFKTS